MAGIYIHIPFCAKKCFYCNFFSSTDLTLQTSLIESLCHEMDLRYDYLDGQPADTLYIGGGTPSILHPLILEKIVSHAKKVFGLNPNAEITLESNPNNLNHEYMKQLSDTSINRLSIGIQSFFDDNLQVLGRIHSGKQAENCLELACQYHFSNLSVDLMYGYPRLSKYQWMKNLEKVKTVSHLSCYSLSLEPHSTLHTQIQNKRYSLPSEDEIIQQYRLLTNFAAENNFIHYEISNFCKRHCFSRHNTAYWRYEPYIGIGPSAHSFNRLRRQWNIADIDGYIQRLKTMHTPEQWETHGKNVIFEEETLTPTMQINEYIMTSLRTVWGCNLQYIKEQFGASFHAELLNKLNTINQRRYTLQDDRLILTSEGSLFADAIARDLFFD
jgi:oxygen-independent coproporphyrinogen-3 oxidase